MANKYYYGTWEFRVAYVTVFNRLGNYVSQVKMDSREHSFGDSPEAYLRRHGIINKDQTVEIKTRRYRKTYK